MGHTLSAEGTLRAFICASGHVTFTKDQACCWKRIDGRGVLQYASREVTLQLMET
jgi:hypothetical protein